MGCGCSKVGATDAVSLPTREVKAAQRRDDGPEEDVPAEHPGEAAEQALRRAARARDASPDALARDAPMVLPTHVASELTAQVASSGRFFHVSVSINCARSLPQADVSTGASDPYVVVSCNGLTLRTATVMRTREPVFNERLDFLLNARPENLEVRIFDRDFTSKDDFLGSAVVKVEPKHWEDWPQFQWVPLHDARGFSAGRIQLQVSGKETASEDPAAVERQLTYIASRGLVTLQLSAITFQAANFGTLDLRRGTTADDQLRVFLIVQFGTDLYRSPTFLIPRDSVQRGLEVPIAKVVRIWVREGQERYIARVFLYADTSDGAAGTKPTAAPAATAGAAGGAATTAAATGAAGGAGTAAESDALADKKPILVGLANVDCAQLLDQATHEFILGLRGSVGEPMSDREINEVLKKRTKIQPGRVEEVTETDDRARAMEADAARRLAASAATSEAEVVLDTAAASGGGAAAATASASSSSASSASSLAAGASKAKPKTLVRHRESEELPSSLAVVTVRARFTDKAELERSFLTSLLEYCDRDGDRKLDYHEFYLALSAIAQAAGGGFEDAAARELFQRLDADHSNSLEEDELLRFLRSAEFQTKPMAAQMLAFLADGPAGVSKAITGFFSGVDSERKTAHGPQIAHVAHGAEELVATEKLFVKDRETGLVLEEHIPVYVKSALNMLYKSIFGSGFAKLAGVRATLQSMSEREGRAKSDPKSADDIPAFVEQYGINMDEVLLPVTAFKNFNEFFYRQLKPGARPIAEPENDAVVVSPADSRMTAFRTMNDATAVWVKGRKFTVESLFGEDSVAAPEASKFVGGSMVIARLAPQDYHRWHMSVSGRLREPVPLPGSLYTVNPVAVRQNIDVYTENVRFVNLVDTEEFGTVAIIAIGATIVGSINILPAPGAYVRKGDEHGFFAFGGSTVLTLFQPGAVNLDDDLLDNTYHGLETVVRVGMRIGVSTGRYRTTTAPAAAGGGGGGGADGGAAAAAAAAAATGGPA